MTKEQVEKIVSEIKEYAERKAEEMGEDVAEVCSSICYAGAKMYCKTKGIEPIKPIKTSELPILDKNVRSFSFSTRALSAMWMLNISTVRDLVRYSYKFVSQTRNVGKKTMDELNDFLNDHNLTWNMDV